MFFSFYIVIGLFFMQTCLCALPTIITACSRNLQRPEQCILNESNKIKPLLAHGNLGDGFVTPPLEPLALDNIRINRGPEFMALFKQLKVNGPSGYIVEKLKADIPNLAFDFTVLLPKLNFTGNYSLKIKLLLLNIQGKGDMTGEFANARGIIRLRGSRVLRNGIEYVSIDRLDTKITVAKAKFRLNNLFNGDPVLNEVGNQFVNENSELFLAEILPGLQQNLSQTFLQIAQSIMKDVTYDELFPDT